MISGRVRRIESQTTILIGAILATVISLADWQTT